MTFLENDEKQAKNRLFGMENSQKVRKKA